MKQKVASFLGLTVCMLMTGGYLNAQVWEWVDRVAHGGGNNYGIHASYDGFNSIYVTGRFKNNGTFGDVGNTQSSLGLGDRDVYVSKYSLDGDFLWGVRSGGVGSDYGYGVSNDSHGNVYISGHVNGNVDFSGVSYSCVGSADIFTAKYDSTGILEWVNFIGGNANETSLANYTDAFDNTWIVGWFEDSIIVGMDTLVSKGGWDAFAVKYHSNGTLMEAVSFGSIDDDQAKDVTTDSEGNVLITGAFSGDMIIANDTLTTNSPDIFVVKLDSNGNGLWGRADGSLPIDHGEKISVDANDNCYVIGWWAQTAAYTAKYSSDGNESWRKIFNGTSSTDLGIGISAMDNGGIFITGRYGDTLILDNDTLVANNGQNDSFVAHLDSSGNVLWAITTQGYNQVHTFDVVHDDDNNCYVSGGFKGTGQFGPHTFSSAGGTFDAFLMKIKPEIVTGLVNNTNLEFDLYPNPTQDWLRVNLPVSKNLEGIQIMDISGKVVYSQRIEAGTLIELDQKSGLYVLQLVGEKGMILGQKKFVIL